MVRIDSALGRPDVVKARQGIDSPYMVHVESWSRQLPLLAMMDR